MARKKKYTKADVKSKNTFSLGRTKSGRGSIDGTVVTYNDGNRQTFLTPSGKGKKYAQEIKTGRRFTNDGEAKVDDEGYELRVTKEGQAYRAGYLDAQKDSANAWKAKRK
ncbi:MAG: hypothetical protein LUD27_02710 [Clostridia bacterium]|nr:hypothetical protein [Clostridia bacterium]